MVVYGSRLIITDWCTLVSNYFCATRIFFATEVTENTQERCSGTWRVVGGMGWVCRDKLIYSPLTTYHPQLRAMKLTKLELRG
jgi:hypothetical protein